MIADVDFMIADVDFMIAYVDLSIFSEFTVLKVFSSLDRGFGAVVMCSNKSTSYCMIDDVDFEVLTWIS